MCDAPRATGKTEHVLQPQAHSPGLLTLVLWAHGPFSCPLAHRLWMWRCCGHIAYLLFLLCSLRSIRRLGSCLLQRDAFEEDDFFRSGRLEQTFAKAQNKKLKENKNSRRAALRTVPPVISHTA